jgi:prevent-host-death family protein
MQVVSIEEAEKHFSEFIEAVLRGEEVMITVEERPAAKLSPYTKPKRRFGVMKGKVRISKDFDKPFSQ